MLPVSLRIYSPQTSFPIYQKRMEGDPPFLPDGTEFELHRRADRTR